MITTSADAARDLLNRSLAAWRGLAAAARADSAVGGGTAAQSAQELEPHAARALLLALDRLLGEQAGSELAEAAERAVSGGRGAAVTMDDVERLGTRALGALAA